MSLNFTQTKLFPIGSDINLYFGSVSIVISLTFGFAIYCF
jgi:hypothetical protein